MRRRAQHSGGPLGCLHAVIGFAACVGFVVGAWHVATDSARVEPSSAIVEPARVEPTTRPTVKPTREPTARPVKPRVQSTAEPIDCADQEDPDLCVELGEEYEP